MSAADKETAGPVPSVTPPPERTILHATTNLRVAIDPAVVSPELQQIIESGGYEAREAAVVTHLVQPDDCVLELGAGLGFVAALILSRCRPRRYIAVEANPKLAPLIEATLRANGLPAARIINAILTNDPVKLVAGATAFSAEHHFWGSREVAVGTPGTIAVPVVPLNPVLSGEGVTVMILDVEGGEAALFEGADLATVRTVFLELHPDHIGSAGVARIFATLHAAGLVYDGEYSWQHTVTFRRW